MTAFKELVDAVRPLAQQISAIYEDALRRYEPEVDRIVRSGSRDVARIEQALDRLLDFGDDEACLRIYKRLCRHYWNIDKIATAEYVMIYRKMWAEEDASEPEMKPGRNRGKLSPPLGTPSPSSAIPEKMTSRAQRAQ